MDAEDIDVEHVERIDRGAATRPWKMDETTRMELSNIHAIHRDLDSVFVPWAAQEPVDEVEALFTVDTNVLERNEQSVADLVAEVVEEVENDRRLDEYIVWEHIEPSVEVAEIDEHRSRVRVRWEVSGEDK